VLAVNLDPSCWARHHLIPRQRWSHLQGETHFQAVHKPAQRNVSVSGMPGCPVTSPCKVIQWLWEGQHTLSRSKRQGGQDHPVFAAREKLNGISQELAISISLWDPGQENKELRPTYHVCQSAFPCYNKIPETINL
jgi:hypothetical protein